MESLALERILISTSCCFVVLGFLAISAIHVHEKQYGLAVLFGGLFLMILLS